MGSALQRVASPRPHPTRQALKANGPLAITIWADSNPTLQFYKAGVYAHVDGNTTGEDHAVTLVGWGEEKMANSTVPYWLIINSWGTTWWVTGIWAREACRLACSLPGG